MDKERLHISFPFHFTSAPSAGSFLLICLTALDCHCPFKLLLNAISSTESSSIKAGVSLILRSPRHIVSFSDPLWQERHGRAPQSMSWCARNRNRHAHTQRASSFSLPSPRGPPTHGNTINLHSERVSLLSKSLEMPS